METKAAHISPRHLPPGLVRREALLELDMPIALTDFADEERIALLRELAAVRASLRRGADGAPQPSAERRR